ncbi:RHS repeat-associated core domain-containing protein [Paenibacillus amylolyticus]|uniref:RHS repeat-associated core domain-containing protein n=1 Tax=Paenibacillus amylolyticus TaxID=1451 RepID=UPI0033926D7A
MIDDAHELSRVLMELDGEGHVKSRYIYGLGLIGREDADGTYLSYHYDLLGSTTLLTDEQNRVTDRYTYGLYGELEQHEGLTQQPFAYNGRDGIMTDANGLYYMRARYYDPKLKRFLNRDVIRGEIQDGQKFNRYAYVNGNPVSYIDPLGLMKCETEGTRNGKTFVDEMDSSEAARYQRYWEQNYKEIYEKQPNTRDRSYTVPGTRSIVDQKINEKTGQLYSRETIYDKYGRRIGNNDYTDHGRPDVKTHTNPHHHSNPWYNPREHGKGVPGLHPETPRW